MEGFGRRFFGLLFVIIVLLSCFGSVARAVTSKVTRESSGADFSKGKGKDVVIGSRGTIRLGRAADVLVKEFKDVWSINSIVVSGGTVYVGTSPNGGVYEYGLGGLKEIYSAKRGLGAGAEAPVDEPETTDVNAAQQSKGAAEAGAQKHLANEHIFAMGTDISGRLLVGISGERCSLCRLAAGELKSIFEPNDAKYIFAITLDDAGNIYLGTGPEGRVERLDPLGKHPEVIYDADDKNILSLAVGKDGFIYAGSDSRGLVYKIDPNKKTATVLYDSDQDEVAALLFSGSGLYAAATSANVVKAETRFATRRPAAGRPEAGQKAGPGGDNSGGGMKLEIANTKKPEPGKGPERKTPPLRQAKPARASHIYRVSSEGFVDDVFSGRAVFFSLAAQDDELLLGTGNRGQLYSIKPVSETEAVIYKDDQASQVTAVVAAGDDIYVGTANPAKLLKIGAGLSVEGTYTSELLDASQPARWGRLQAEADVPEGCEILVSCRSGNVKDANDATFSDWTEAVKLAGPVELGCPAGRFCQYKLILRSADGRSSPVVREVAVASSVPNLAPKVESVLVSRIDTAGKKGFFKVSYNVRDGNGDKLIYKIDFRKVGWGTWIEIKDEIESSSFEWDGRTVEDGRYELRVTASDERSNTADTFLTGSRVSEPVVVDNTGPVVARYNSSKTGGVVKLKVRVSDELSAIGKFDYTVDSNSKWKGAVPDDLVFDTKSEDFTVATEKLKAGEHIVTLRMSDGVGNMTYKSFDVNIEGD